MSEPGDVVVTDTSLSGSGVQELERTQSPVFRKAVDLHLDDDVSKTITEITALDMAFIAASAVGWDAPPVVRGFCRALIYEYGFESTYWKLVNTLNCRDRRTREAGDA